METRIKATDRRNGFHHHELSAILGSLPEAARVKYLNGFRGQVLQLIITMDDAMVVLDDVNAPVVTEAAKVAARAMREKVAAVEATGVDAEIPAVEVAGDDRRDSEGPERPEGRVPPQPSLLEILLVDLSVGDRADLAPLRHDS